MIADLLICFFLWLARHTPPKIYTGRNTSSPYLVRYFLTKASARSEGMGDDGPPPKWGIYLHHFCRGDDDPQLHNHPWQWAVSLVLKGGYLEERRVLACTEDPPGWQLETLRREVRPWSLNRLTHRDFHRVDLFGSMSLRGGIGDECWTLFLVGPVVQSWGFWDRVTGVYTPWKKFLGIDS